MAHGPRYIDFHDTLPVAYVVNELGSNITVFAFDVGVARSICATGGEDKRPVLTAMQTISTIPSPFPREMNTCGRLCVHPGGRHVVVSNRGHDSLAVYRIELQRAGRLRRPSFVHTAGASKSDDVRWYW